jgi:adenosine deaminase
VRSLRRLPKIDLHRHLEGSLRFPTFVELAREAGIDLKVSELRRRTSMKGERPGFRRFLSKFDLYRGLYPSRDWIERVAYEAAEDAKRDGVVYLELRFSPTHFGRRLKAAGEDVAAWVVRGARRAGLDLRFIATFGRDFGVKGNLPTTRAVEGTGFFSGLDLAGDESVPAAPFRNLFRRLDLPCTIHAGEAGGPENVREAIEAFGARRIGHGVRVLECPRTTELARSAGVLFEVCPTSEIQTGAAKSWRAHPATALRKAFLNVAVCTDDPGVCGTTMSGELERLRRTGWRRHDLGVSMDVAACAAFRPKEQRRALRERIHAAWAGTATPPRRRPGSSAR